MLREVDIKYISDGRLYGVNDMVKADTCNCDGCHKCCVNMGNTIVLDPFDVIRLVKATDKIFNQLLEEGYIELNIVDGLILPNIAMSDSKACKFLNEEGRCSIHANRPGICRLFPLGRIYDEKSFKYFLQTGECDRAKTKVKVKKWIDVTNMEEYDKFVLEWHNFIKKAGAKIVELKKSGMGDKTKEIAMYVLNTFYIEDILAEVADVDMSSLDTDAAKKVYMQIRKKIVVAKRTIQVS